MDIEKPKRRTHWQALAHKRYRRMTFIGGDGEWLVMTMCPPRWQYRLFEYQSDAQAWMAEMDAKGCGTTCKGKAEPQDMEDAVKRLTMVNGKMWFPQDVDPADCDWDELPGSKADGTAARRSISKAEHGANLKTVEQGTHKR
jgi:hypothetical protein